MALVSVFHFGEKCGPLGIKDRITTELSALKCVGESQMLCPVLPSPAPTP